MKGFWLRLVETQKKTYVRTNIFSKLQTHFGSTYYFNKIWILVCCVVLLLYISQKDNIFGTV